MLEHVLDTVALRVLAFAHPQGVGILLKALAVPLARFPVEVYNQDEDARPLELADEDLSELARGLRYARRQASSLPAAAGRRYQVWLDNAVQLQHHLAAGRLVVDPLTLEELPRREDLQRRFGLGRGESACLTLVERYRAQGVFLSSDEPACRVAQQLGLAYLTLPQVLDLWVERVSPTPGLLDALIDGMRAARFGLTDEFVRGLRRRL